MKLSRKNFEQEQAVFSIAKQDDLPKIAQVCKALSLPLRVQIVRQLQDGPLTVPEIAKMNYISISAAVYHVGMLYDSGIIDIVYQTSPHGEVRTCYRCMNRLDINLWFNTPAAAAKTAEYSMGVGQFIECEGCKDCSFVSGGKLYHTSWDNVYMRERFDAQLFFATEGFVTYAFPSNFATLHTCTELSVSLELCSETFNYNNTWKSDVTFWINGIELLTYTCPGDFGGRPGILNPPWWDRGVTQYGEYKTITVNDRGVFLDGEPVSGSPSLKDLRLNASNRVLFRLGNKPDAQYVGGFNLFGKEFGDYPQDIVLKAKYVD